jgi:hypothetical protein
MPSSTGSPNQISGKCTITVNGQRVPSKQGSASITPGYGERTPVQGENGPEGFTEKSGSWMLSMEVLKKAGVTAKSLWNLIDVTILFECDNGDDITLVQATTTKVGELKSGDAGTWQVEMFAMQGNES